MKLSRLIFACLILSALLSFDAFAQRFRADNEFIDYRLSSDRDKQTQKQKKLFENKLKDTGLQIASEGPIDPDIYVVGPGDIFTISFGIGSLEDQLYTAPVSVSGTLFIPTLGGIDVREKTLSETFSLIKAKSEQKYDLNKIELTAVLTQPRLIKVHVLGQVNTPGTYTGSAIDKVTSFVQQAEGFSDWAALDKIQIKHTDGKVDTIDLSAIYSEADLSQDVFLRGGDAIFVPPIATDGGTVSIEGNAEIQGMHEIVKNETVKSFLYRIRAIDRSTDLQGIYLQRNGDLTKLSFNASENNGSVSASTQLQAGDKLFLSYLKEYVYVHGAVRNPGYFPYFAGLKALDYAGLAGGTEEMGSLDRIQVLSAISGKKVKGAQTDIRRGDSIFVPFSYQTRLLKILEAAGYIASILIAAKAVGLINADTAK
ncbi:MAG: SLBB domain-containing protein [Deferribacteres bacterium]|nr:SLBB domain-containing protein [Deferribacteres bacterium]